MSADAGALFDTNRIRNIERTAVADLLRTSEGFHAQNTFQYGPGGRPHGQRDQREQAHALLKHLRGVSSVRPEKTRFASFDDMVDALRQTLTAPGTLALLQELRPGGKAEVKASVRNCAIECWSGVDANHRVSFSAADQIKAAMPMVTCKAIVHGRDRAGTTHLHIQSFYPEVSREEVTRLLEAKTRP
jgi:hypothetical protein